MTLLLGAKPCQPGVRKKASELPAKHGKAPSGWAGARTQPLCATSELLPPRAVLAKGLASSTSTSLKEAPPETGSAAHCPCLALAAPESQRSAGQVVQRGGAGGGSRGVGAEGWCRGVGAEGWEQTGGSRGVGAEVLWGPHLGTSVSGSPALTSPSRETVQVSQPEPGAKTKVRLCSCPISLWQLLFYFLSLCFWLL